jgi:hypothetical protein
LVTKLSEGVEARRIRMIIEEGKANMKGVKVLTQEKYDSVPALLERGMDRNEIAALFGVTPASLQVLCSNRGISLRRGGRYTPRRNLSLTDQVLDLNQTTLVALREKARTMGMNEAQLISDLLETIVTDDLYGAVLDLEEAA